MGVHAPFKLRSHEQPTDLSAKRKSGMPPFLYADMSIVATCADKPTRAPCMMAGRHVCAHRRAAPITSELSMLCAYCAAAVTLLASRLPRSMLFKLSTPYCRGVLRCGVYVCCILSARLGAMVRMSNVSFRTYPCLRTVALLKKRA